MNAQDPSTVFRSIAADLEDAQLEAEKERNLFIKEILLDVGLPLEDVWPDISITTTEQKIALRELLSKFEIEIINDGDHGTKIYVSGTLLAEWFKPRFVMRKDPTVLDKTRQMYYEIQVHTWYMYEEERQRRLDEDRAIEEG